MPYQQDCLNISLRHLTVSHPLCQTYPEISIFHAIHAFEMIAHAGIGRDIKARDHEQVYYTYAAMIADQQLQTKFYGLIPAIGAFGGFRKPHQMRNATLYVVNNQAPSDRFKVNDAQLVLKKVKDIIDDIQQTFPP